MLASDVNNPDFQGSQHPDASLRADFFMAEDADHFGAPENRKKGEIVPHIKIWSPGSTTNFVGVVKDEHKQRFPSQWLYFQMKNGLMEGAANLPGTPLEEFKTEFDGKEDYLMGLKAMRFFTLEQMCNATDAQIQNIMGGFGLRERCRAFMKGRLDSTTASELAKRDDLLTSQAAEIAELRKMVMEMATAPKDTTLHAKKKE